MKLDLTPFPRSTCQFNRWHGGIPSSNEIGPDPVSPFCRTSESCCCLSLFELFVRQPQARFEFLGRQPDEIVNYYASRCRALLFPGEEDFGMAPLEANAAGRPVIAYRGGGAIETVEEGTTGIFFDQADSRALAQAIKKFENLRWDQRTLRRHAEKFDRSVFAFRVLQFLGSVAPSSCSEELLTGARLLSERLSQRVWPRLALVG